MTSPLAEKGGMDRPTREDLIAIIERAFTPHVRWRNRDSSAAHRQLGECYALLKAGCDFWVRLDGDTYWVNVEFNGFNYFDWADYDGHGPTESESYYVPTAARVDGRPGEDWY